MPVTIKEQSESNRFTGTVVITPPYAVAEKLVEGRDGMPDAVKLLCSIKGEEEPAALFVPLHENAIYKLQAFIPGLERVPTQEGALRKFLEAYFPKEEFLVYVQNGSVRSRMAGAGKHRAKLYRVFTYENEKNTTRARIVLRTEANEEITWTAPWEGAVSANAETNEISIASGKHVIQYLVALGLDLEKLEAELIEADRAKTLFPHYDDSVGVEVPGFFGGDTPKDIARALNDAVKRHGPYWVEVEVIDNKKWGPSAKGMGTKEGVQLTRIIVADGQNAAFEKELAYFYELWENLTKVVLAKPEARFVAGHSLTEEGKTVAVGIIKPVMLAHPHLLKDEAVQFPPNPNGWHLDGLVALDFVGERLLKLDEEERFNIVNLTDPTKLLEWAAGAVPELSADPMEEEVIPL